MLSCGPPSTCAWLSFLLSSGRAIEHLDLRVGSDADRGRRRLEADGLVEARAEHPPRPVHEQDCCAIRDADDPAEPAVNAEEVVDAEPEAMLMRPPDEAEKFGLI